MAESVRGNPQVDVDVLTLWEAAVDAVKMAHRATSSKARNLDYDTIMDIESHAHVIGAEKEKTLSVTSKYRGVRQAQRTAKVGGGRRRR